MTTEPTVSTPAPGEAMYRLIAELYPICRSITGVGFRETLRRIGAHIPLTMHEVPSGTPVFDWTVPDEWNIRDAYIKDAAGRRVVDFHASNLHVVSYSVPVRRTMPLAELRQHLHTLPEHPDWIPYRTSYYRESWGFCLSQRQLDRLPDGDYEVCIDATLRPGHLTYGECLIEGETPDEVLVSCHSCHPSLCNDNLSGMALATYLAMHLGRGATRYTYRFLFIPGTIGSITWLALNEAAAARVRHGLVVSCVGDAGRSTYKRSRRGNATIDRAVEHVLRHSGQDYETLDFVPYGYDERQYCSPGFDLPVGCLTRTPNGRFPEYHTSADDLDFVHPEQLADSLAKCVRVTEILEHDATFLSRNPKCEPRLGKRGLYSGVAGRSELPDFELALLWVLNLADGRHTLLDVAERAGMPFHVILEAARALREHDLLEDGGAERHTETAERPAVGREPRRAAVPAVRAGEDP